MKIVYTAGPITADTPALRWKNCIRAWNYAHRVWKMGAGVICPQFNTLFMDDDEIGYEMFMEADYEMIKRSCDAVLMLPGWEDSKGACNEKQLAHDNDIPVFNYTDLDGLQQWIQKFVTEREVVDALH